VNCAVGAAEFCGDLPHRLLAGGVPLHHLLLHLSTRLEAACRAGILVGSAGNGHELVSDLSAGC
jgi:hypothetical protein